MLGSVDAVKDHKSQRILIPKNILMVECFVTEIAGFPKFADEIYLSLIVGKSPVKCI